MSVYVARYPCSLHHLGYLLSLTIWSYALLLLCAIDVIFYQVNMLMLSKQPIWLLVIKKIMRSIVDSYNIAYFQ